jgi:hypothetical protein
LCGALAEVCDPCRLAVRADLVGDLEAVVAMVDWTLAAAGDRPLQRALVEQTLEDLVDPDSDARGHLIEGRIDVVGVVDDAARLLVLLAGPGHVRSEP